MDYFIRAIASARALKSTMLYITLEQQLFQNTNDQFQVRVAKTTEDIKALLEVGFEYILEKDGLHFFRRRK